MASGDGPEPLSFDQIRLQVQAVAPNRALPTAVLVGTVADQEVRILAYLLKCRPSGFMVALPDTEEVQAILDSAVDPDGCSLVVSCAFQVNLEDSRSWKFGTGQVILADFAADCAGWFTRAPALRGPSRAGLIRIMVGESVAKPSTKSALQVADQWIADMDRLDDALAEYFTPDEGLGNGLGEGSDHVLFDPEPGAVSPEVVRQLQARIAELEAASGQQAASVPVVDLEPRSLAPGRSVLFDPSTVGGQLDSKTMQKLRQLAGPAPPRLSRTEAVADAPARAAQSSFAELEAGVDTEDEVTSVLNASSDPLHHLLALQMRQTAMLVQKLSPAGRDPITAALGSESGNVTGGGVKGCVAREAFVKTMDDVISTGKVIARNAAADLGLPSAAIDSSLMRTYVERRMPLGDQRLLTHMAQYLAVSWQLSFEHQQDYSMGILARGLMMVEQMAIDQGRCQMGWLLTAYPDPNIQAISLNKRRVGLTPYAKLAAASWVAGNIAYLRDLDYLETRLKNPRAADKPEKDSPTDDAAPTRKPWKPKKPKGKGTGKDDASESSTL